MTPEFFIRRPIFAWVIALGILLAGLMALRALPVEQYPSIAPPQINVNVTYPGADAAVLETNVTQIIEEELNSVEGYLYMDSTSRSNGSASIELTLEPGTDIDVAQMEIQNLLSRVEPRLPEEVRRQGIRVFQSSSNVLLIVSIISRSGELSSLELGHHATTSVVSELRRIRGVGDIREFYTPYAMRIWLNPERLASFGLTAGDVMAAVREQNAQPASGAIGDLPLIDGIEIHAPLEIQGRFTSADEFAEIILRANPDGSTIRLRDVARVELGAQEYASRTELNGRPAAGLAVQLAPGANALEVADAVRQRLGELESGFPEDIGWEIPFDTTPFISASIRQALLTLIQAVGLVVLVMLLFLQSWRTLLIPTIVIPVTLIGTCLGLWALGFSINLLTLFGMVLAIGTLVDDTIVVVENVKRLIDEEGLRPYEATVKAMSQVTAPIVGTTLALIAVFIPLAFFPGSTGGIYQQFAVTLAIAVSISTILALTLTPALAAALLKAPDPQNPDQSERQPNLGERLFAPFNRGLVGATAGYHRAVAGVLAHPLWFLLGFVALCALTAWLFLRMPTAFLPEEDQGSIMTVVQAPPGATLDRTAAAMGEVQAFYGAEESVDSTVAVFGFSFFGQGQAHAMAFIRLIPWADRGADDSAPALVQRAMERFAQLREARVFAMNPPAIPELGTSGGFTFKLEDRGNQGYRALKSARDQLLGAASQSQLLADVRPEGADEAPRLRLDIDRVRARSLGLTMEAVNDALGSSFASAYANDFNHDGRVFQVLLQADAPFRMTPQHVLDLQVRNKAGASVPFGAFARVEWTTGPTQLQRYNGYPSMTVSGNAATGYSSGEAMQEMERLAEDLPPGFDFDLVRGTTGRGSGRVTARSLAAGRAHGSGCTLRKLDHPRGGSAGGALRRAWRGALRHAARPERGHLFQRRSGNHNWPVRQERHPHSGIRDGRGTTRQATRGGNHQRGQAAFQARVDDLAYLHPGHAPTGSIQRRGCQRADRGRHRCHGRDDTGDPAGAFLHPSVLSRGAPLA